MSIRHFSYLVAVLLILKIGPDGLLIIQLIVRQIQRSLAVAQTSMYSGLPVPIGHETRIGFAV